VINVKINTKKKYKGNDLNKFQYFIIFSYDKIFYSKLR
jgi:hypothetical protein